MILKEKTPHTPIRKKSSLYIALSFVRPRKRNQNWNCRFSTLSGVENLPTQLLYLPVFVCNSTSVRGPQRYIHVDHMVGLAGSCECVSGTATGSRYVCALFGGLNACAAARSLFAADFSDADATLRDVALVHLSWHRSVLSVKMSYILSEHI